MARECPPIKIEERFTAKSVKKLGEGHFLVDMGKNGAGFVELVLHGTTKENRGNWISMYPAEMINEADNGVDQRSCTQSWSEKFDCVIRDSYRMAGTGEERWRPFAIMVFSMWRSSASQVSLRQIRSSAVVLQ